MASRGELSMEKVKEMASKTKGDLPERVAKGEYACFSASEYALEKARKRRFRGRFGTQLEAEEEQLTPRKVTSGGIAAKIASLTPDAQTMIALADDLGEEKKDKKRAIDESKMDLKKDLGKAVMAVRDVPAGTWVERQRNIRLFV